MATLYATRGLQGSGKTTRAKAWVAEDPTHRARVNRDDLRLMVHAGFWDGENTEKLIIRMRNTLITTALKMGQDVVCDDTNLPSRTVRDLRDLARLADADFIVWDMTDVPIEICIERDAAREKVIGETVIRKAYAQFIKGRPYPLPIGEAPKSKLDDVAPYVPDPHYEDAVIVDIDGTVAHMAGRSPYDETRVHEDTPNQPVIDMIRRLHEGGTRIIFCSGRTDKCWDPTKKWIIEHVKLGEDGEDFVLFMRKHGDSRKDNVVKREIFEKHLRHAKVNIVGVFDDRNQVVRMWRDELGLTVFQVADGDF